MYFRSSRTVVVDYVLLSSSFTEPLLHTGKSFSEALLFSRTWGEHVVYKKLSETISVHNMFSPIICKKEELLKKIYLYYKHLKENTQQSLGQIKRLASEFMYQQKRPLVLTYRLLYTPEDKVSV